MTDMTNAIDDTKRPHKAIFPVFVFLTSCDDLERLELNLRFTIVSETSDTILSSSTLN